MPRSATDKKVLQASHDKLHDNQCRVPLTSIPCRILPRSSQQYSTQGIKKHWHLPACANYQGNQKGHFSQVTTFINIKGQVGEKYLPFASPFHCSTKGMFGSCCSVCRHAASPTHPSTLAQNWQVLRAQIPQQKISF